MPLRRIAFGASLGRTLIRGLALAALLLVVSRFVLSPVWAVGISMMPTYDEGDLLLLNRLAYRYGDPRRGDVVAITMAGGRAVLVKRIIGLPGERVRILDGTVFVNDQPLDEPYVQYRVAWDVEDTPLGTDEYYVVGDNRSMPAGNHDFGVAARGRLLGRMVR